jgi:protein-tyrosine phosphatase
MTPWEEHRTNVIDRTPSTIKKFRVPVTDSELTDLGTYFDAVTRFIDDELKNGGRVLVHCVAGVSRSTTLVLAYLIRYRGFTLLDAFDLVAERRRIAWPNDGFYRQLISYERSLKNKNHVKSDINKSVLTQAYTSSTARPRSPGFGGHSSIAL